MLILSKYIAKHELAPLDRIIDLDDVLSGAQKVRKGLGVETRSPISGFKFYKVRIGPRSAVRMMVFLVTENQKLVPILIRRKNDKIFGTNMAMSNPHVVDQIRKNMDRILEDIRTGNYEEFPL